MLKETSLYAESWNVAWRQKSRGSILSDKKTEFNVIKNAFRYWAADPFVFEHGEKTYIFAELYDYVKCKGCLGYYELSSSSPKWVSVIEEDYHLSYPYIFENKEGIFIMPESGANKDLTLYKAVSFPDKWEKVDVLRKNVQYGDTTPFEWEDHKYALTYDVENVNYKLVLLDLENEDKDREISCQNINCRRPAGAVFLLEGKWIRPAQDCEKGYGKGLYFYEFQMDEHGEYSEKTCEMLSPEQLSLSYKLYRDGMHTYNGSSNYEVKDIKTRRFNILNFLFRILGKVRRKG